MGNVLFYVNPPPRLPLQQVQFLSFFDALATWATGTSNGATITLSADGIDLTAIAAEGSEFTCIKQPLQFFYDLTWAKIRELKIQVRITMDDGLHGSFFIGMGLYPGGQYAGLELNAGSLRFHTYNGSDNAILEVEDWSAIGAIDWERRIHIKHYPGSHDELWLDDELVASLDEAVPTGTTDGIEIVNIWGLAGYEDPTSYALTIKSGYAEFYQEKTP